MTQTRNRPAGNGAASEQVDETEVIVPPAADVPRARAYAGPPVPGRGLWAVTVLSCPICRAMHQHRVFESARLLAGRVTRCCPTTGRWYLLSPVQRRREARRAAA
jgi:hypothetical protein